ncbi:protein FAM151B [Pleurodeles waltl]|uniref:protein FAM151B n=1 Tax=Pleurodeles waltl TaxID=8319 RepID=UPI00370964EE
MNNDQGSWKEGILDYFLNNNQIKRKDGAEIIWYHAANSKSQLKDALTGAAHMIEADVLLRGQGSGSEEPIMAHPPQTDSDITLLEWLNEVLQTSKGIKLDFKSLEAVKPSMILLQQRKMSLKRPLWINADILPGPCGSPQAVDAECFLNTVISFFPDVTLSLGWTTGWHPDKNNEGYSWEMVRKMECICSTLSQPVTFPVRAALVRQSWDELLWLLQQSNRYSLTIWTGRDDKYPTEDLLFIRENLNADRVYYDVLEPQNSEFKQIIAQGQTSK